MKTLKIQRKNYAKKEKSGKFDFSVNMSAGNCDLIC
jgi:hypothetical protein